jgi:hypothetical protein
MDPMALKYYFTLQTKFHLRRDFCNMILSSEWAFAAPRANALHAPVFLGSLTHKTEKCAPTPTPIFI